MAIGNHHDNRTFGSRRYCGRTFSRGIHGDRTIGMAIAHSLIGYSTKRPTVGGYTVIGHSLEGYTVIGHLAVIGYTVIGHSHSICYILVSNSSLFNWSKENCVCRFLT